MSAANHRSSDNHDGGHGRSNDKDTRRRQREAKAGKQKEVAPMEEGEEESTEDVVNQKKLLAQLKELGQQTAQILQEQERIQKFLGVESEDEDDGKAGAEEVGCKVDKGGKSCIIRGWGKAVACDENPREVELLGGPERVVEEAEVDVENRRNPGLTIGGLQSGLATFNCALDVQEEHLGVVTTALQDFFQDFLVETTREAFIERANLHILALEAQTSGQSQPEPQRREQTGPEQRRVYRRRSRVDSEEEPEAEERMDVDKNTEDPEGGASAE
ncbi:hypothetical protein B0H14DRAFT_2595437 [Mycena olivaceomarginata]|nr:hypothetical protein B0H14DRAFT_2595437 [Mycena olivaceomarginata]